MCGHTSSPFREKKVSQPKLEDDDDDDDNDYGHRKSCNVATQHTKNLL